MGRWLTRHTKTIASALGQTSVAVALSSAAFEAKINAVASNSAVFFALSYIVCKNKEVRSKNKELENEIAALRKEMQKEGIDDRSVKETERPNGWLSGLGFAQELLKDPMLYLIASAAGLDIINCISVCLLLSKSTDHEVSDSSSGSIFSIIPTAFWSAIAAPSGIGAVVLASPQIIAAHNLRQYQDELAKELEALQRLRASESQKKQVKLEGNVAARDAAIAKLGDEVAQRDIRIRVLERQIQEQKSPTGLVAQQWESRQVTAAPEPDDESKVLK